MKKVLCFIVLTLISFSAQSQNNELDALIIELAFQDSDSAKVDTSVNIIKLLLENEQYDKALSYISQSEKLSKNLNYTKGLAEMAFYKGLVYAYKDNYVEAIDNYSKAKQLFSGLNDTVNTARVDNSLGIVEIEKGNFTKGLEYSLSAINNLEQLELKEDLSKAYKNLAKAYLNTNEYDNAVIYNLKTLKVAEELDDTTSIIETQTNLANIYALQNNHQDAITYYKKVLESNSDDESEAKILPKLGRQLMLNKDYVTAMDVLNQSIDFNRALGNKHEIMSTLNSFGEYSIMKGKYRNAEKYLYEASSIAKVTKPKDKEVLNNYKLRKKLDSLEGNFKLAYLWQGRYFKLKQELEMQSNYRPNINAISTSKIIEEKNEALDEANTNATLLAQKELENTKNEERISQFRVIFYGLAATLLLLGTVLYFVNSKRRSRIEYTKQLEAKNKEIEAQKEEILAQTKHLEETNSVKDKLFSIVSHDLKDSVTSINTFINLLKEGTLSQDEFYDLVPELSDNANNASLLLYNLLNWSKSQMNSLKAKPVDFNIQEVFKTKLKLIEQTANKKGIKLNDQSIRTSVFADRSMVEIVLQNLLTNSVKFCESSDVITVSNHLTSNGNVILSISDTGLGISEENQKKLFKNDSFTTIGTGNEKGTGLGLTICKELVELNNGRIWVESTPNIGSTFYIELPKSETVAEDKKKMLVRS